MADPLPYSVSYSFSGFQANSPTSPLPAPKVDNELANIATAIQGLVNAIKDVRRSDGALENGIVTYDSLALGLQLTFDPTNGDLVAAAVAGAQASAAAAAGSAVSAGTHDTNAAASAAAAAASAGSVNLALYLPKAGNLAGLGSTDTALANLNAMKIDGSTAVGRLAPTTISQVIITDWNTVVQNGWYSGTSAANQPGYLSLVDWLVEVIAFSPVWVTQIAYPFAAAGAASGTQLVIPFRRHGYNNGGVVAWTEWESQQTVPVGTSIMVNAGNPPPGFLIENGALVSRATYPALWNFAVNSGILVSEAAWAAGQTGGFSSGDLATTFRLPDSRGEFIRGWDSGRGVDVGRSLGAWQPDLLRDHTHPYQAPALGTGTGTTPNYFNSSQTAATTGSASIGGAETRPRNISKLFCIKY